ncbi:hypothetical protein LTR22_010375 [Elasticomyces elasticus]|nr:hypothetical protein LTR22_010375 [Elasticomyces elasticus]KAK4910861.1 hypothetical protein LTR49_020472 [Elasticomyces elasticus]KAK5750280.1 hypothetical protein LTS12_019618 [Elasticomyces elasticus]
MHNQLKPYWRGRFNAYLSFTSGEDAEKRLDEASFSLQKAAAANANSGDSEQIELWQAKVKRAQEYFVGLGDEQQPATLEVLLNGIVETLGDAAVEGTVETRVSREQTDAEVEVEEDGSRTTEDTAPV